MKSWLEPARQYLDARTLREKWLIVGSVTALIVFGVHSLVIAPLGARRDAAVLRSAQLDGELLQARRLAAEIRRLQGGVEAVKAQIAAGPQDDLAALLEQLARAASIGEEQLESVKPTPVSGNPEYPETRVQVALRGASLAQTVRFLHEIENAKAHLILRSLQIRRGRAAGEDARLDVTLSVSSFQKG